MVWCESGSWDKHCKAMVTAFAPLQSSLPALVVIRLKIKLSGFLAWGQLPMLVHVPSTGSQSLQDTLSGLRAALNCFYPLPSTPTGGYCYG